MRHEVKPTVKAKKATAAKTATTKKKSSSPAVSQLKMDPNDPIPIKYGGQTFSILSNTRYLPFLSPNDSYAQLLLESRLLSVTNNACITTKRDYCAGKGFMCEDADLEGSVFEEWAKSINLHNQSAHAITKEIFEGYFTNGNVPIECVRLSVAGKKRFFVYVHPLMEWRLSAPDEDGIIREAIQSKLFYKEGILPTESLKEAKVLPIYNPMRTEAENWKKDAKGVERTLFWYKNPVSGFPHYGLPTNVAGMIYQIIEYKAARYNLDEFENNMVVASILALKGVHSQEEANRIGKLALAQHTGDGKRGRTLVIASEQGIEGSELHKLDTKKDGSFTDADNLWSQKIIFANQWDAVLAGLLSASTLGKGSGFLSKIIEHKLTTVIRPAQQDLMDNIWNPIFKLADEWLNLGLEKHKILIENAIDISGLTDVDITPAVMVNEVREAKGLKPDPAMDGVYMQRPSVQKEEDGEDDDDDDDDENKKAAKEKKVKPKKKDE